MKRWKKWKFLLFLYVLWSTQGLVIFKQVQETFLTTSNQTIKFRRAKCFPSPPLFLPLSLLCVPHTRHSCDRDPNHYWHTAPSPLCGFLCSLARSATGPPPHFDLDLGGNVIQRGAEAQRHYCSHAVGPPLHIRLSSLAGHMRQLDVCSSKPPAEVVLKCMVRVGLPFFNWRVKLNWAQRATVTKENQV